MLIITRESVRALKERLEKGQDLEECRDELKKMIEIKQALLWRAERSCACVGTTLPTSLAWEAETLEEALAAVDSGRVSQAVSLLDTFVSRLESEKNCEPSGA